MSATIALIGLPTDVNSSFLRGAAAAPAHIRAALHSEHGNSATELGGELGVDFKIIDQGDLELTETPEDDDKIEAAVAAALNGGHTPILLGGDHAVTFPIMKAIHAKHGAVSILHFDAHPDLYDELDGNRRSHASPFARIMESGLACRLVQVGIRTATRHQRAQAARFGVETVPLRGFTLASVPAITGPVYVSIDLDGFDPAYAPGVSHPEPGGLTVREVMDILADLKGQIIGADIVELNPTRDINGITATLAAKLVKELAALMVR